VPTSPLSPHLATPAELKERLEAERALIPFVVYRDERGEQRIIPLEAGALVRIGRDPECGVCLAWDGRVSRLHAEVMDVGGHWVVADDGLSRNGTFLNGEPVAGRRRLGDGDLIEVGKTLLAFRDPARDSFLSTAAGSDAGLAYEMSISQRRVLVALCRPFKDGAAFATPPTNQQIADELHLSLPAVKTHLRMLFQRYGLSDLPQNEKRAALVRRAFESGAVTPAEL
jgi:pSer/pThr/pTyr-binding forkhead associated (FHA) protein